MLEVTSEDVWELDCGGQNYLTSNSGVSDVKDFYDIFFCSFALTTGLVNVIRIKQCKAKVVAKNHRIAHRDDYEHEQHVDATELSL